MYLRTVISKDGTTIAYERSGSGPAVLLVSGGLDDGSENGPLTSVLSRDYTVYGYARRGRGASGDKQPYALQREVEDIQAVIEDAGSPLFAFGASSGGALLLEACAAGLAFDKVAVYEAPYCVGEMQQYWLEYVSQLTEALSRDDRDGALELFMRLAGSSEEDVAGARASSHWPGLLKLAPTLGYDAACLGDGLPPADRLVKVTQPVLVATGTQLDEHMAELPTGFFDAAADALMAKRPATQNTGPDARRGP